ncbi:MAG: hypothetical protein ACSLEW_06585 [Nocardioides sp.]
MSDPFESLRTMPTTPPPAAEIRRRGDVRRRRATVAVSLGAVAAVAAVAIPVGLALGGSPNAVPVATNSTSLDPEPTDSEASTTWITSIPADIDLTVGWDSSLAQPRFVDQGSEAAIGLFYGLDACGSTIPFTDGSTDLALASWELEDYSERRTLAVFPDAVSAANRYADIIDAAMACSDVVALDGAAARDGGVGGDDTERSVGAFGMAFEQYAGGVWAVYRTGNAILVVGGYTQGGEVTAQRLQDAIDLPAENSDRLRRDQMCVFTTAGCTNSPGTQVEVPRWNAAVTAPPLTGSAVGDIADLPITDGFPASHEPGTDGLIGPTRSTAIEVEACDAALVSTAAPRDGLTTSFSDVEYHRARTVLVFDDADAAATWFGDLFGYFARCPTEKPTEDGSVTTHALTGVPVGDEGFATRAVAVLDGEIWGTGQDVTIVTRFGQAIVLDLSDGEGAFGDQAEMLQRQLDEQAALFGAVRATWGR